MKSIPISVILASVVLLIFVALLVYLNPMECLAVVIGVLLCGSAIRVAYFVIEGE
jgi:hypothetical protein